MTSPRAEKRNKNRDAVMRYIQKAEAKATAEPNHAALQHAGLALILVLVILVSLVQMVRVAISGPSSLPEIITID